MVVYKSKNICSEWIRGSPVNTVYNYTKNGWFNGPTFETWFFKQFVPSTVDFFGQIVLIADNLGSGESPGITTLKIIKKRLNQK